MTATDMIACGKEHFKAIEVRESPAQYIVARSLDDILGSA